MSAKPMDAWLAKWVNVVELGLMGDRSNTPTRTTTHSACIRCGRTLTSEHSIAQRMGDTCAARMGVFA